MGPKLKVGDRVRLLNSGGFYPEDIYFAGAEGTVTESGNTGGLWVHIDGSRAGASYFYYNSEVLEDEIEAISAFENTGDQTQKADAGKSNPDLLEVDLVDALKVVNRVLDYGAAKYGERGGWRKVATERYSPAARRHRIAFDRGEVFDPESGLHHRAHQICNLLFMLQTEIEENPNVDFMTFNDPPQDHRL